MAYFSKLNFLSRVRQLTDLQGGSREGVNLGGSSGSTENPTSKKFHFCIIQTMLNTISQKNFEKSLDLAIFVNFSGLPQGGG